MSDKSLAILITLIAYKLVLVGIGLWAQRRTHDNDDFFLGGRGLGAWVAAISASASSSSAWTLLGVSGAAFAWGLSAIWLFPAVMIGFLFNWIWLAPRLRRQSRDLGAITVTDMMVTEPDSPFAGTIRKVASMIIIFCFAFYVASQFQAAGNSFQSAFGMSAQSAILLGAGIILVYTLLGGFWAVSVTDTLQGLIMALAAIVLPVAAVIAVGGPAALYDSFMVVPDTLTGAGETSLTGRWQGPAALGFVVGTLGIGAGYPGQPHVVNRFMALKDENSVRKGRLIALGWAVIVYCGMLLLGWSARLLFPGSGSEEQILFTAAHSLFHPVLAGIIMAAVLSAIMSTADSQILVTASSVAYDLRKHKQADKPRTLWISRLAVLGICVASVLLALYAPDKIFSRVLFAWHALGSSFGPVLITRLAGRHMPSGIVLATLLAGFILTVLLNAQANAPGDFQERLIPFVVAMAIAWFGSHGRR